MTPKRWYYGDETWDWWDYAFRPMLRAWRIPLADLHFRHFHHPRSTYAIPRHR